MAVVVQFRDLCKSVAENVLRCEAVVKRVACDAEGNLIRFTITHEDRDVKIRAVYEGSTRECLLQLPRREWREGVEIAYVAVLPNVRGRGE